MKTAATLFKISSVIILSLLFQAQSCQEEAPYDINDSSAIANDLAPQFFYQMLELEKGILIDLRTPAEYDSAHIEGAINLDIMSDNFKPVINRIDQEVTYFIYCTDGSRSQTAAEYLKVKGVKRIYTLKGGIRSWKNGNFRTVPQQQKLEDSL
jgi:rhodanese-related sulfurtransferase